MRRHATVLAAAFCFTLLTGCTGSVIEPLPAGGGQGSYVGTFLADEDNAELGQLQLVITDIGAVSGSGTLSGRSVAIEGTFAAGVLEAILTDTLSQENGDFEGEFAGGTLSGDFRLEVNTGGEDIFGFWDAVQQ
jgi:hypothetical protein